MGRRLDLQALLQSLIGVRSDGKSNVYFQPPSTVTMSHPCIVYELSQIDAKRADNRLYSSTNRYMVTVIDQNPESEIPGKVLALPMCSFDRHYTYDGLNHDVVRLYY
jgi:hypothetical protein